MEAIQELSERKTKILHAIIKNYLETGEPVGSRTISKYTDLNLSSATIRNEMADLEELGYIMQPHTSAGRIPSDNPAMRDWTFENDNGRNPQAGLARRYVEHWEDMRTDNIGCLFWGGVGTGKSYRSEEHTSELQSH